MTCASLRSGLDARVLPHTPAARPGLLRALTGAYTGWYLGRRWAMFRRVHRTDPDLFQPAGPVGVLRRPLPPVVADAILAATMVSDAAFTLGLRHQVTGPVHAALTLWTMSYRNSWSMIFHNDNNLVLHTAILGATRSADAVSIDALSRPPAPDHWRYATAVRTMQAVTTATYLVSGVAKVKGPLGWSWASGESLRSQIAADGLRKELLGGHATGLGVRMYPHTPVFRVLAAGSLVLELIAPLTLLDRRVARLWAVSAFGMHWGIKAIMGITFRHHLCGVIYAPFVPLERILPGRPGVP